MSTGHSAKEGNAVKAVQISGHVEPKFAGVKAAFEANFRDYGDVGAACCIYVGGRPVVNLWGGIADPVSGAPWQEDTLQLVFSAAKGFTSTCVHILAQQGLLDLDAPVADYWPEFGCCGKEKITIRMVMSHRAGLAAVDGDLTLDEIFAWAPVVEAIARQEPNWPPGTAHGYHPRSFGWILGELVRRVTGQSLGQYLYEQIALPQSLDLWIGLPATELSRCAKVIPPSGDKTVAEIFGSTSLTARVMNGPSNLFDYNEMWNQPELLQAEMPSSNGVCTAAAMAAFYAGVIGSVPGVRLLSEQTIADACQVQSTGPDKVVLAESIFGTGYALPPFLGPGVGPASFGHGGAGGSLGFADPEKGIGFGYVMNQMRFDPEGDPRTRGLVEALYHSL
jgi:CubicO group peptidase (beta-lactamase class C family)